MGGHQGQAPGEDLLRQGEARGVSSIVCEYQFIFVLFYMFRYKTLSCIDAKQTEYQNKIF